jgi:hypothetical protein
MPSIARPTDWKTEPMPEETDSLNFHRIFSSGEFERVSTGLIPREMEDKWFIYYDNHTLNIHRSWTGFHIYKVTIQPLEDNTFTVTQTIVNRNKEQYNQQNNAYDVALLRYLIDRLLLGIDVPFPMPTGIPQENSAIYKQATEHLMLQLLQEKNRYRSMWVTGWEGAWLAAPSVMPWAAIMKAGRT